MLNDSKLIGFVATRNPAKAKVFYEKVLGLRLVSDDPFALVFEASGRMLRVAKVESVVPAPYTVLGWDVRDINGMIRTLKKAGARFERFEGMNQDEDGVWTSPGGGKVAWFKDPDGNTLSLTQFPDADPLNPERS